MLFFWGGGGGGVNTVKGLLSKLVRVRANHFCSSIMQ